MLSKTIKYISTPKKLPKAKYKRGDKLFVIEVNRGLLQPSTYNITKVEIINHYYTKNNFKACVGYFLDKYVTEYREPLQLVANNYILQHQLFLTRESAETTLNDFLTDQVALATGAEFQSEKKV
jgi:hypothetical protein